MEIEVDRDEEMRESIESKENIFPVPGVPMSFQRQSSTPTPTPKRLEATPSPSVGSSRSRSLSFSMSEMESVSGSESSKKNKGERGKKRKPRTKTNKIKMCSAVDPTTSTVGQVAEDEYIVEKIMGKKYIVTEHGRVVHYYIKWKGWSAVHNTWEPIENLDGCQHLLDRFEKSQRQKKRKSAKPGQVIKQEESDEGDLDDDDKENGKKEEEMMRTRQELIEYGIKSRWPADLIPLKLIGVVTVEKQLCYLVKIQTKTPKREITPENCVVVRASGFREYFPHIVISYYQNQVIWVMRHDASVDLGRKAAEALHEQRAGTSKSTAAVIQENKNKNNLENSIAAMDIESDDEDIDKMQMEVGAQGHGGDVHDDEQTIFIKKDEDLFGLPNELLEEGAEAADNNENSDGESSSSSDMFTPVIIRKKEK